MNTINNIRIIAKSINRTAEKLSSRDGCLTECAELLKVRNKLNELANEVERELLEELQ